MSFAVRQTIPTTRASKDENLFAGRSTLRAEEKNKDVPKPKNSALQAYLAKNYDAGASEMDGVETTKRKKKKKSAMDAGGAIRIVDQDVSGFNTLDPKARTLLAKKKGSMGDDDDEEEDEAPVIANPEEAEALMRLANKAKSGSGWVPATKAEEAAGKAGPSRRYDSPDASPPRRGVRHGSPDASPPRRRARHDSPDASPPRRAVRHNSPDASPPRRRARHDSPDASPQRRGLRHDSPDASPPRRGVRHDSPDASPPRRGVRHDSPDASPPRRGVRHDSPGASPPRRRARHDSPDASPPRKRARSPGAGAGGGGSGGGGGGGGGAGGSQAMRHRGPPGAGPGPSSAVGPSRQPPHGSAPHHGPPRPPERMGDGTAAGLVSADQLARDIQQQREAAEERRRNAEGRGAQTVYRDKATGRVMTADEALKAKEDDRAKRKKPSIYDEDQTLEWRGGLAQKREAEERQRAAEEEAAKPFHRTNLDDAHDAALRDRVRFGDPFAHLARRKQPTAEAVVAALTERYDVDKLGKSGFKIPQEVPLHSWLKRGVAAPANRYNIRPGRHWDGVDRSNGFEKKMFKHQNLRAAKELEARLWSMGDM